MTNWSSLLDLATDESGDDAANGVGDPVTKIVTAATRNKRLMELICRTDNGAEDDGESHDTSDRHLGEHQPQREVEAQTPGAEIDGVLHLILPGEKHRWHHSSLR